MQSEWRMDCALRKVWLILEIIRQKYKIHSNWSKLLIHTHGLTSWFLWEKATFSFAFSIFVLNITGPLPSSPPCYNLTSSLPCFTFLKHPYQAKDNICCGQSAAAHILFFFWLLSCRMCNSWTPPPPSEGCSSVYMHSHLLMSFPSHSPFKCKYGYTSFMLIKRDALKLIILFKKCKINNRLFFGQ